MSNEVVIISGSQELIPDPNAEIVANSGVDALLGKIRPAWQSKNLINRVKRLLPNDPSSACQRIFNASMHDLREKIVMAGLDIAKEAAQANKLPSVNNEEDILERYSIAKLIDLAYRMGLLSRPEWRRITRAYEIRRDLEHEDDEYEAGVEDCVYIFKTCIDVILANDPVQLLRLTEIKEIVEQPQPITLAQTIITDYRSAPIPRQLEIYSFLISSALNVKGADIIRQNCFIALNGLRDTTHNPVILESSQKFMDRLGKRVPNHAEVRVAYAAGLLPYLKRAYLVEFFKAFHVRMESVGYCWGNFPQHGALLSDLQEVGGIIYCPEEVRYTILHWLVLCYIGEPGGYGVYGRGRTVFYSDTGAPIAREMIRDAAQMVKKDLVRMQQTSPLLIQSCKNKYVSRRFESLLDLVDIERE